MIAHALILSLLMAQAEAPFDPAARVREAIATARPVAFTSAQVDWSALEAEMIELSKEAKDTADLLPAYHTLMVRLGDGHSFLQVPPDIQAQWEARHGDVDYREGLRPPRQLNTKFSRRLELEQQDLPLGSKSVRLLNVPAFNGNANSDRARAFADSLFTATAEVPAQTCAYILDLRGNTGGNFWPMVLGLSGLLGPSEQGIYRAADGSQTAFAHVAEGKATVITGEHTGVVMATSPAWREVQGLSRAPVALITDDSTASSGEGIVIAFIGRPQTRSFGARTYGVASANDGYTLSDGIHMVITTSVMVDANNQIHPHGIEPDQPMNADGEAPIRAASDWLKSLPACSD